MAPERTPAVTRALEAAQRWAQRSGSETVEPPHLLLGLLDEEEGRVATLLIRAGLDVAAVRAALGGTGTAPPEGAPLPPLGDAVSKVVHAAQDVPGELSVDNSLTTEQVLLALLQADEALRGRLESHGMAWEQIRQVTAGVPLRIEDFLPVEESLRLGDLTERMDTERILDASFNRAREALRVIEDYCRFVLDDAFLTQELKRLRHDLVQALVLHDSDQRWDLAARETLRDVGTTLTARGEHARESLVSVVQANAKRLQEALRSLEEFGKIRGPALGRALEELRYRSYTLERAVVLGVSARQRLAHTRLYLLLTGSLCEVSIEGTIAEASAGGVDIVQLREKDLPDRALLERAREVRRWTHQAGVLFIMNDRPDIARLAEADGVHLGQDELPVKEARRILGPDALIGVSTHSMEQLRQALLDGASYVGIGPTFPSKTKTFADLAGLDFIRQAARETSLPMFAIGGITANNLADVVAAGARRIAVSQAICRAEDPRRAARGLRDLLDAPSGPV